MKRQRGLRRYYRNLSTCNDFDKMVGLDFNDPDAWFDNWHWHFDWKGFGNASFKRRKPHLDKLFRHFEMLAEKMKSFKKEFHLYALLHNQSSENDALFIYTSNPNNNEFPFKFPSLSKKTTLTNKDLQAYINTLSGYAKLYGGSSESFCLIYKTNIGQALCCE